MQHGFLVVDRSAGSNIRLLKSLRIAVTGIAVKQVNQFLLTLRVRLKCVRCITRVKIRLCFSGRIFFAGAGRT